MKKEEFKIPDGDSNLAETFFNPEREGWLTKEGGKYKSRHKRWFILKEGMLYYFKQPTVSVCVCVCVCVVFFDCWCFVCVQDDDLIGSIPLGDNDLMIRPVTDPKAPPVSPALSSQCVEL